LLRVAYSAGDDEECRCRGGRERHPQWIPDSAVGQLVLEPRECTEEGG
jgi:hypothetical protein